MDQHKIYNGVSLYHDAFHITVPLWGESTSDWWIPLTKGQKDSARLHHILAVISISSQLP